MKPSPASSGVVSRSNSRSLTLDQRREEAAELFLKEALQGAFFWGLLKDL